jgi:hypothetical protein
MIFNPSFPVNGGAMRGTIVIVVTLLGFLAAALGITWWGLGELADTEMGRHGYIALVLGTVVTLALGMGLMGLVFYSSRRGYDDQAHGSDAGRTPPPE